MWPPVPVDQPSKLLVSPRRASPFGIWVPSRRIRKLLSRATLGLGAAGLLILFLRGGKISFLREREIAPVSPTSPAVSPAQLVGASQPASEPAVSLPSGFELAEPRGPTGRGTLKITNGTQSDAVLRLVDIELRQTRRFVYIAAGDQAMLRGIGPCHCVVRFALGRDWDEEAMRFRRNVTYSTFDEGFHFTETDSDDGVQWAVFEVTLHRVVGGNAKTSRISEGDFFAN